MSYELLVMPGEGIGPETVNAAMKVFESINKIFDLDIKHSYHEVGQSSFEKIGFYLSPETELACNRLYQSNNAAILFGAVAKEPIRILRKKYDLFANIRPISSFETLTDKLRLKSSSKIDFCIVRELSSGIYYGRKREGTDDGSRWASQEMFYNEKEIRRIVEIAFRLAEQRKYYVTLIHKNNAIEGVFNLWLEIAEETSKKFLNVRYDNLLVDNMAMQLILKPELFDVLLCPNLFGDILSDLGAGLIGSIGVLASISQNENGFCLYESIGGTAPDIAGKGVANPIASILSLALFYKHTVRRKDVFSLIILAINQVLSKFRTCDVEAEHCKTVSTDEMTDEIIKAINYLK